MNDYYTNYYHYYYYIIIIKNERLSVQTGDSISGAAESSIDRMRRSPNSGFVFPSALQVNKANTHALWD